MSRSLALFVILGCADPSPSSPDAPQAADAPSLPPDAPSAAIVWSPCALHSDEATGSGAECAEIAVPVRWDDPAGPTITLFVKRVRALNESRGQLWLLNGGPGGPGADWEPFAEAVAPYAADTDIYLPDHRGTGRSSRLGCPAEADDPPGGLAVTDAEMPGCIAALEAEWGERLAGFITTEAARDLVWLIDETREAGQDVHVLGGSYGTFWAQRYLQLAPAQATAVTLIGIAPPTISFVDYDVTLNRVGEEYLAACGADDFCAARLGPDPAARAREILDRLDDGHCPQAAAAGLDRRALRQLFAGLIFYSWDERALVPAVLYRIDRCAPADVAALENLAAVVSAPQPVTIYDRLQAPILGLHIGLSELWTLPSPPLDQLLDVIDGATFSTELAARFAPHHDAWPRYTPDARDGAFAETATPMLMLQGTLDPATPATGARAVGEHFSGESQHYVELPGAAHSWLAPLPSGGSCSVRLFLGFHADPRGPLDTGCVASIEPLDFQGSAELASGAFGTSDLWENPPGKPSRAQVDAGSARLRATLVRARRHAMAGPSIALPARHAANASLGPDDAPGDRRAGAPGAGHRRRAAHGLGNAR